MDIAGVQSGTVGMAIFDAWLSSLVQTNKARRAVGSPLLAAVNDAFEEYINAAETQMGAQISALASYVLTPNGQAAKLVTAKDLAPFLALNILA